MRKLGIGLVGVLGGLLVGGLLHELLARAVLDDGAFPDSLPLALLVGLLMPALAVAGAVVALRVAGRRAAARSRGGS